MAPEEHVKRICGETIANLKNVNPRLTKISMQEAREEDSATVIAIRSFATHEDGRLFIGKDVYMKMNRNKWIQVSEDGRRTYDQGFDYIPNPKIGYVKADGDVGIVRDVEYEIIVFLKKA